MQKMVKKLRMYKYEKKMNKMENIEKVNTTSRKMLIIRKKN